MPISKTSVMLQHMKNKQRRETLLVLYLYFKLEKNFHLPNEKYR